MFLDVNSGSAGAILILTKQDERLSPASRLKDNLPGPSSLFFFSSRLIFCLSVRDPLILIQRARPAAERHHNAPTADREQRWLTWQDMLRGARRKRQKWPKLHEASIFCSSSTCCSAGTLLNVLNDPVWDVKRAAVHLLSELGPLFDDSTIQSLNRC
eukprot:s4929_g1.t1